MSFTIKTNSLQITDVLVRDIGISIPGNGGSVSITNIRDLDAIRLSRDLVVLTNDNVFGTNSSTLIISDDGVDVPQDFSEKEIREASLEDTLHKLILTQTTSTGVLQGGVLSKNINPAKFDISDGYGRIVNNVSDPRDPEYITVSWSGKTAITVTNLATAPYSYILIDSAGDVFQQTSAPTPEQLRDYISLGALIHPSNVVISSVVNNQVLAYDPSLSFVDFANSFGAFNLDGNVFYANGSNLLIDRSSGKIFKYGANYLNNLKSPNIVNTNSVTGAVFIYDYQTAPNVWTSTLPTNTIDPNKYDTGFGLTGVSNGYWTVQPLFLFAETEAAQLEYGQAQYASKSEALASVGTPFNIAPQLNASVFRGWLALSKGVTGLNNSDYAVFVPAGKFGLVSSTSGGGGGEITTASNVGYQGIGWYLQKTGSNLEFKNIYAASNKISITETPSQRSVDLDIVPGNIDHNSLNNVLGGETGYSYHLSTDEYTWIHNNPTGVVGYTGAQGYTGAPGDTGLQGATGIDGITGAQGDTGASGVTGLSGITGIGGITGLQGYTGPHGITGGQGITGIDGATGIQGYTGVQGNTGIIGQEGATGVPGVQGITGLQGYTGISGSTGLQGSQGETGILGPVGLTGAVGQGIAAGGETGQFLAKLGSSPYVTEWRNITPSDAGADPAGTADALKPRIADALSSGILSGGAVSINVDPTLFDIAPGTGLIVDNNTHTYKVVTWGAQTGVSSPYIATDDTTYVAIDETGSVVMQPDYFDNEALASLISIGWIDHTNRTTITYNLTEPYMSSDVGLHMHQFFEAFGAFNISGNEYYDSGNGLILGKTAGSTFDNGTNYVTSIRSPNILENLGETGVNFKYYYRTAPDVWYNDGPTINIIDPNNYDCGVGLTGVPNGKFTIQQVLYYAPNAYTDITYGQAVYDTISDAGSAINKPVSQNPYNAYDTFRAWLIVQQGITGLGSTNSAVIINAGRYGVISGRYGGGGGSGEANTASNVGLAGIGLFDVKSGVDLHFKNINSGSNRVSVSNDIPNKTVNIDVVPSNINHYELGSLQGGASGAYYHLDSYEYNWIHSNPTGLQGHTGAEGITGIKGIDGVTGFQGITGIKGIDGVTGAQGITGIRGIDGVTGAQGVTGGAGLESTIGVVVDGAGNAITTGSKGFKVINGNWLITDWTLLGKETGSCVVDVRKGTYANYPFTTGIAGTEKPTLSNQIKNQNLTLASWFKNLSDGDVVEFVVDSASIVTKIILSISVKKE